ncbi:MAG: bifunctional diguanylate cyclase/phosphodiesterase [Mesorhizobium amorphae]|nr:MAG: bifunctional diguanylate cyclase/phosphodiesterase [Mesorhizobium amorphae]
MLNVIACITLLHDLRLVVLAGLLCVFGSWSVIGLLGRASATTGTQRGGWHFLSAVAAGATIWCTHFIAMLAYDPGVPVSFDPVLTIVSLLIAIGGSAMGLTIATTNRFSWMPALGGAVLGLAISAMHYSGMIAYRVAGIIEWDRTMLAVSVLGSTVFGALAIHLAMASAAFRMQVAATGVLVFAILVLHFTGITAMGITPMLVGPEFSNPEALSGMALVVAAVGLLVVGVGLASYLIDGSARAETFEKLRRMALHDALTGLPNRKSFNDRLEHELTLADENGTRLAVAVIDLNRFKQINDLRGHAAGDEVLKVLARRMSGLLVEGEFVARHGGDEFAALKRVSDHSGLLDFLKRIEVALHKPVALGSFEATTGGSIGVSIFPEDARIKEVLVANADLAMYRAKTAQDVTVRFYEASMDELVRRRRMLAEDLRMAIERNELSVHFQVQTAIGTGRVTGYEALARWTHPVQGPIPPTEFIPVAEENGLILQLGEWVLREACRQAAACKPMRRIAVNLSPAQFSHPDLPKLVCEVLLDTGLPPSYLELELTESAVIADKLGSLHTLRRIKTLGISLALDDFGTGYSSLDTLRTFPFDRIKLDRSFVSEMETSAQAQAIVRAMLTLGKSLNMLILAEGIETRAQLDILTAEGCDEAQGYLLGRPMPMAEIAEPGSAPAIPTADAAHSLESLQQVA